MASGQNITEEDLKDMLARVRSDDVASYEKQQIIGDIVATGNLHYVKQLLEFQTDATDFALAVAVDYGYAELVKFLLDKGVDPNIMCDRPLLVMASSEGHLEVVKLLLEAGADVNLGKDEDDYKALHAAASGGHLECVEVLIKAGANLNSTNYVNSTPLADAAFEGHEKCVDLLINAGADVNTIVCESSTALMSAVQNCHVKCTELLFKAGANVNISRSDGMTALHDAATNADCECLDVLLKAGADVNEMTEECETPLTFAVYCLLTEEKYKFREKLGKEVALVMCYNASMLLIKAGADVREETTHRDTVRRAFEYNNVKCVELIYQAWGIVEGDISDDIPRQESSLKHLCRETVRRILMDLYLHSNLVISVPRLNLPRFNCFVFAVRFITG